MKVRFVPQDVEYEIGPNESVLKLAQRHGVFIKSVCNGVPSCAECRVRLVDGDSNVLPPAAAELKLIGTGHFVDRRRLSCQMRCFGDIVVDLTEQIAKQNNPSKKLRGGKGPTDQFEDSYAIKGSILDEEPDEAPAPPPARTLGHPAAGAAGGDLTAGGEDPPPSSGPRPAGPPDRGSRDPRSGNSRGRRGGRGRRR